jgi:hypothetical protein
MKGIREGDVEKEEVQDKKGNMEVAEEESEERKSKERE